MESIRSSDCFYINAQYLNTTTTDQPAEVLVLDDSALLQRSEGYAIHLTRWSVDTQTSLYFVKADEAKLATIAITTKHGGAWAVDRTESFYIDENLPTVTAFLQWWNSKRREGDNVFPAMSIDGAGRFHLEPVFSQDIADLGNHHGGVYDHMTRVQIADPLSALIGFETLTSSVTFDLSNYRKVCEVLGFVKQVIGENRPDFFLQLGGSAVTDYNYMESLREVGEASANYIDMVKHTSAPGVGAGQGGTHIMSTKQEGLQPRIIGSSWGKIYWDEMDNAHPVSMSQYIYVSGFQTDATSNNTSDPKVYASEYISGGSPGSDALAISFAPYAWHRGAQSPLIPLVYNTTDRYTAQFIDQESIYGQERTWTGVTTGLTGPQAQYATYLVNWEEHNPDVVFLPANSHVEVGDLVEIPCDISVNHRVALFGDGTLLPDGQTPSHWGVTENFLDRGVYYSWPVVEVTTTFTGLKRVVLMLPIPQNIGLRLLLQVQSAQQQGGGAGDHPTVFISTKRPPFINMVFKHLAVVAVVTPDTVTLTLPVSPVRVGDAIWLKQPNINLGPFAVTTVTLHQAGQYPHVDVTVPHAGWPVTYSHVTDAVVVVSQLQPSWHGKDLDGLKKMFPVWMTQTVQNVDWTAQHVDGTLCLALNTRLHAILNKDPMFAQAYASFPSDDQRRTVPTTDPFPTLVVPGAHHRLELQEVVIEAIGQGPYDIVQIFADTRYDYRDPNYVHQMVLIKSPGFVTLLADHGDEHFNLDKTLPQNQILAPAWEYFGQLVVCGTHEMPDINSTTSQYIVACNHFGYAAAILPMTQAQSTVRKVLYSQTEKLGTQLRQGNTAKTVQLPGSTGGRTLNLLAHDYMRSRYQGQVDLCQAFHSIVISSRDIGVLPERSNQMRSLAPIISSYLIGPTVEAINADKYGKANGYSETPYGTVQFVERIRRFHKLQRIPGDLRSFSIQAEICPRDTRLQPTQIMLAPGEAFSCQLMFVKEF